jgi:hypothetical protein
LYKPAAIPFRRVPRFAPWAVVSGRRQRRWRENGRREKRTLFYL